jgi:DNA topoisomerase IA
MMMMMIKMMMMMMMVLVVSPRVVRRPIRLRVWRAQFSAVTPQEVLRAIANLRQPNR